MMGLLGCVAWVNSGVFVVFDILAAMWNFELFFRTIRAWMYLLADVRNDVEMLTIFFPIFSMSIFSSPRCAHAL